MNCEICGKQTENSKILCSALCELQYKINKVELENLNLKKELHCMRKDNKKLNGQMDRLFNQFKAEIRFLKKNVANAGE
jgi:predicted RNase H-like nuclease (RuvC/YqgF family)